MTLVLVFGATGAQGGSVVRQLLKNPKYKIRALTRNAGSDSAKQLASQGVEVVIGDVNDVASLSKAFSGVEAAFVVTAYWPSIMALGRDGAGEEELQQFKNVAHVASTTASIQHLVLSTLPPCSDLSGGKFKVPHFDYKSRFVAWLKTSLPDLWAKTTEFWPGFYVENWANFPLAKPVKHPATGTYMMMMPSKPDATIPLAGDLGKNCGTVVEAVFAKGSATFGKIALLVPEYCTMDDAADMFAKVTGQQFVFVELSDAVSVKLFGPFGEEMGAQMRWSEEYPDWTKFYPDRILTPADLGVEKEMVLFEEALTSIKASIL